MSDMGGWIAGERKKFILLERVDVERSTRTNRTRMMDARRSEMFTSFLYCFTVIRSFFRRYSNNACSNRPITSVSGGASGRRMRITRMTSLLAAIVLSFNRMNACRGLRAPFCAASQCGLLSDSATFAMITSFPCTSTISMRGVIGGEQ